MENYKLSIPLSGLNVSPKCREEALVEFKRCGASRVFISARGCEDEEEQQKIYDILQDNIAFFKSQGFEVGVWASSSFGNFSDNVDAQINDMGNVNGFFKCHAGEKLINIHERNVKLVAKMGADIYMLDDDFHQQHGKSDKIKGCFCDNHRRLFNEYYGDKLDFDMVKEKFWDDTPNPYREAYLKTLGRSLENFAIRLRKAADSVNPNLRIAMCAHGGDYYVNGTDVVTLAKLLAGNTKPLVRFIGAPYWDYFSDYPDRLSSVFELERAQAELLKDAGIETMAEGDSFPRPRHACSSAQLECFDMAMRADGKVNGILKYMMPYRATPFYERGYVDNHVANEEIYRQIQEHFSEKTSVGARVYSFPDKCVEAKAKYSDYGYTSSIIPKEGYLLSQLSIPTTYEGNGVAGVSFGENTRYLTEEQLNGGILTDIYGAMVLQERGIDVGLKNVIGKIKPTDEYFGDEIRARIFPHDDSCYQIEVSDKAKVISSYFVEMFYRYTELDTAKRHPATYLYENAKGQRFCVMAFNASASLASAKHLHEHFRSYAKSHILMNALEWLGQKKLPARCENNPDLYVMCKRDEKSLAVGLWDLHRDKIRKPEITLDKEYSEIEFINCTGILRGDKVELSTLYPYEFCGFVVK